MNLWIILAIVLVGSIAVRWQWSRRRPRRPAWASGESLHDFIRRRIDPKKGGLPDCAMELPDASRRFAPGEIRWVAGGLDGAFGHHGAGEPAEEKARRVLNLLKQIADDGSPAAGIWKIQIGMSPRERRTGGPKSAEIAVARLSRTRLAGRSGGTSCRVR